TEGHERAAEWVAVDGADDLDQATRPEEGRAPIGHDIRPAALGRALLQGRSEGLRERASVGHAGCSTMYTRFPSGSSKANIGGTSGPRSSSPTATPRS